MADQPEPDIVDIHIHMHDGSLIRVSGVLTGRVQDALKFATNPDNLPPDYLYHPTQIAKIMVYQVLTVLKPVNTVKLVDSSILGSIEISHQPHMPPQPELAPPPRIIDLVFEAEKTDPKIT